MVLTKWGVTKPYHLTKHTCTPRGVQPPGCICFDHRLGSRRSFIQTFWRFELTHQVNQECPNLVAEQHGISWLRIWKFHHVGEEHV